MQSIITTNKILRNKTNKKELYKKNFTKASPLGAGIWSIHYALKLRGE